MQPSPVSLLHFLLTIRLVQAQLSSSFYTLSIAILIIALAIGVVLIIIWVIIIWSICKIYWKGKKEQKEFSKRVKRRLVLEQRYKKQSNNAFDSELRTVISGRNANIQSNNPHQKMESRPSQSLQGLTQHNTLASFAQTKPKIQLTGSPNPDQAPLTDFSTNGIPMSRFNTTMSDFGIIRTNSNTNNQNGISYISRSDSNSLGIIRSTSNWGDVGGMRGSSSTSSDVEVFRPSTSITSNLYKHQLHNIQTQGQLSGHQQQLQSLREIEEMDVRQDVDEGPPRYNTLFPQFEEGVQALKVSRTTSPFTFNCERADRMAVGGRQALGQIASWPDFN